MNNKSHNKNNSQDKEFVKVTSKNNLQDVENNTNIELNEQIEQLTNELQDVKNYNLRLLADMDNIRKNTTKEISRITLSANTKLIEDLIPYFDSLNSAIDNNVNGADMLYNQFINILKKYGVDELNPNIGDNFDAMTMEAIMSQPTSIAEQHNTVAKVFKKGYSLNGNPVIFPKVIVYLL